MQQEECNKIASASLLGNGKYIAQRASRLSIAELACLEIDRRNYGLSPIQ